MTSETRIFGSIQDLFRSNIRKTAKDQSRQKWINAQEALEERVKADIAEIARKKQAELNEALSQNPDYVRTRLSQAEGMPVEFSVGKTRLTFTESGNDASGTNYTTLHAATYDNQGIIQQTAFMHIRTGKLTGQIHYGENLADYLNGIDALPKINEMIASINNQPANSQ